ncbi:MAG: DUF4390 domain-containing protein [Oxalobacteraceae bacterium]
MGVFRPASGSHRRSGVGGARFRKIRQLFLAGCLLLIGAWATLPAQANDGIEFVDAALQLSDEGYALSSNFSVDLTPPLEDALMRGIPLYFKLQLEVSRPRWYWFDDVAIKASRSLRLSYNVLTRQYRASIDGSLHRNFSRLDEMLALLRHTGRWQVAEPGALKPDTSYSVAVQLSLDVSQLPKPIQVSAMGSGEWRMSSGWARFSHKTEAK